MLMVMMMTTLTGFVNQKKRRWVVEKREREKEMKEPLYQWPQGSWWVFEYQTVLTPLNTLILLSKMIEKWKSRLTRVKIRQTDWLLSHSIHFSHSPFSWLEASGLLIPLFCHWLGWECERREKEFEREMRERSMIIIIIMFRLGKSRLESVTQRRGKWGKSDIKRRGDMQACQKQETTSLHLSRRTREVTDNALTIGSRWIKNGRRFCFMLQRDDRHWF